jgi:hypothetical protein
VGDEHDDAPQGGPRYGWSAGATGPTGPTAPTGPSAPPQRPSLPRVIPDAPVGFVGSVRPTRSRIPLVLGTLLVVAAIGLGVFVVVRVATDPGTPWAELTHREQANRLEALCRDGDVISDALAYEPGAERQDGTVVNEDENNGGTGFHFPLDPAGETEAGQERVTLASCVRIVGDAQRIDCEVLTDDPVETLIAATFEVRYVELRTGEVVDREEVWLETPGCPASFDPGITMAIEDQTSIELLELVDDAGRLGAQTAHTS